MQQGEYTQNTYPVENQIIEIPPLDLKTLELVLLEIVFQIISK